VENLQFVLPKHRKYSKIFFSIWPLLIPVLIHVNGMEESVLDKRYFDKVIDFGELSELGSTVTTQIGQV